jgi:hypothetical protein
MTEHLKQLAELAQRINPMDKAPIKWFDCETDGDFVIEHDDDRKFIAAASPDVVLGLIAQIEQLKAELEAEQALCAMQKSMVRGLLERRRLDEESMKAADGKGYVFP